MIRYGYRFDDAGVVLPQLPEIKEGSFTKNGHQEIITDLHKRPIVGVSIGMTAEATLPVPDQADPVSMARGVAKRFASAPPRPDRAMLRRLKRFVRKQLDSGRFGSKLSMEEDDSIETWLDSTNYPEWRKDDLRKCEELINKSDPKARREYYVNKSFMKDEEYPEFKYPRGINSRLDSFKVFSGPIFRLIEKRIFASPEFIKKIPVKDRPKYIEERLRVLGGKYFNSDYSSFEAAFRKEIMDSVEMVCYQWFTSEHRNGGLWFKVVSEALTGTNVCKFKYFTAFVKATRMSGDMCTSLGNGFTNLMLLEFICEELGLRKPESVVEGDDSLSNMKDGRCPTKEDFARIGFDIKCETFDELSEASFCGLIYSPEDLINISNPHEVLCSFGWLSGRYAKSKDVKLLALLRCCALSLIYQYPGAPIFTTLGCKVLELTRSIDIRGVADMRHVNAYDRDLLLECSKDERKIREMANLVPPIATRLLMEEKFGVSVEEQIRIEKMIFLKNDLSPITYGLDFSSSAFRYNLHYTKKFENPDDDQPYFLYGAIRGHRGVEFTRSTTGIPMFVA